MNTYKKNEYIPTYQSQYDVDILLVLLLFYCCSLDKSGTGFKSIPLRPKKKKKFGAGLIETGIQ